MAAPLPTPSPSSSYEPFRNPATLSPPSNLLLFRPRKPVSFLPRAAASDQDPGPDSDSKQQQQQQPTSSADEDPFESRLNQVRLRYRSGTGKKAEIRKEKKSRKTGAEYSTSSTSTSTARPGGVFLPPVPLKEPVSGGLKVDFGFTPYSERVNGRLAGLGLAALLLVELATGKSVINYHTPSIVFIQVYFSAAACAVYLKFEKEKVSKWPQGDAASAPAPNDQ